ncbi:MAG: hypothetical protein ABII00_04455 [Elusimicrobiota bacterium]
MATLSIPQIKPSTNGNNAPHIRFHYKFTFIDGTVKEFEVALDAKTLSLVKERKDSYPGWTRLSACKCPNCPLSEADHPRCPAAVNLADVVDFFKDSLSSETVDVEITTAARTYTKRTPLYSAVSGLVGLLMPASGCPMLEKLKPMVRTHLPFATLKETLYRMVSMYMMAQYFQAKRGKAPDWRMTGLIKLLEDLRMVNRSFCERLYDICSEDATLNAVVHLDCFADNAIFFLQKKGLEEFERSFVAHFRE